MSAIAAVGSSFLLKSTLLQAVQSAGLTSNLQLCLDASDPASYTSGQSWLDRSGNGDDFFLGTTSGSDATDPTYVAGGVASYFSGDGGDLFTYDTTNETWMQNIHKDNALWSALFGFYKTASTDSLSGTASTGLGKIGFKLQFTSDKLTIDIENGGGSALVKQADSSSASSAWHIAGCSINEAGGNVSFLYGDGGYLQVSSSNTFDAAYSGPSASSASFVMQLCALGNSTSPMANGSRIAFCAFWSSALTKANFDTLYASLRGRLSL